MLKLKIRKRPPPGQMHATTSMMQRKVVIRSVSILHATVLSIYGDVSVLFFLQMQIHVRKQFPQADCPVHDVTEMLDYIASSLFSSQEINTLLTSNSKPFIRKVNSGIVKELVHYHSRDWVSKTGAQGREKPNFTICHVNTIFHYLC